MRMHVTKLGAVACLSLSGVGCSLTLDVDTAQCKVADDCGTYEGRPTYACESGLCRPVACVDDAVCTARGSFVCASGACTEALCTGDEDCREDVEVCRAGRCVDGALYCFSEKAPLTSSAEASLEFTVVGYGDKKPLRELSVKVCAIADTPCNSPIGASYDYDAAGLLRITGLENGLRYSIRMLGRTSDGEEAIETEYYMERPVVGRTVEAERFELVSPTLVSLLAASAGASYDATQGAVLAQFFGCDGRPLAGVSLTSNRTSTLFYLTGAANTSATETDSLGQGGFVNMAVGESGGGLVHKLSFAYEGKPVFSFSVVPRPGVMTYLYIYLSDYGTTESRADTLVRE